MLKSEYLARVNKSLAVRGQPEMNLGEKLAAIDFWKRGTLGPILVSAAIQRDRAPAEHTTWHCMKCGLTAPARCVDCIRASVGGGA